MTINDNSVRDKFFFAEADADFYDDTIELTVPYYSVIHQTMIDILGYHLKENFGDNFKSTKGIVLDVGAGTGKESISVLGNFPKLNILAIDLCQPMEDIFETNYKLKFGKDAKKRYKYIVADIIAISEDDETIRDYYLTNGQQGCKAAISAYCIHHFQLEEKRKVYQKMFDLLEPGGILINMDLFNYGSQTVSTQAHEFDIAYIKKEFDDPSPQFVNSRKIPFETRQILKEKWVKHMVNDNILDSVSSQIDILKEIGFTDVECVFKYWQQGVIRAKKPLL